MTEMTDKHLKRLRNALNSTDSLPEIDDGPAREQEQGRSAQDKEFQPSDVPSLLGDEHALGYKPCPTKIMLKDRQDELVFIEKDNYLSGTIDAERKVFPAKIYTKGSNDSFILLLGNGYFPTFKKYDMRANGEIPLTLPATLAESTAKHPLCLKFRIYAEKGLKVRIMVKFTKPKLLPLPDFPPMKRVNGRLLPSINYKDYQLLFLKLPEKMQVELYGQPMPQYDEENPDIMLNFFNNVDTQHHTKQMQGYLLENFLEASKANKKIDAMLARKRSKVEDMKIHEAEVRRAKVYQCKTESVIRSTQRLEIKKMEKAIAVADSTEKALMKASLWATMSSIYTIVLLKEIRDKVIVAKSLEFRKKIIVKPAFRKFKARLLAIRYLKTVEFVFTKTRCVSMLVSTMVQDQTTERKAKKIVCRFLVEWAKARKAMMLYKTFIRSSKLLITPSEQITVQIQAAMRPQSRGHRENDVSIQKSRQGWS